MLSWNIRPMLNRIVVQGTRGVIEIDRFLQVCHVRRVLPGPKFIGIVLGAFSMPCATSFAFHGTCCASPRDS